MSISVACCALVGCSAILGGLVFAFVRTPSNDQPLRLIAQSTGIVLLATMVTGFTDGIHRYLDNMPSLAVAAPSLLHLAALALVSMVMGMLVDHYAGQVLHWLASRRCRRPAYRRPTTK